MARNACLKCGNAIGTEDCEEACANIDDIRSSFKKKSLLQTAYPREMAPYIDAAKKEIEAVRNIKIDMNNPSSVSRSIYSAILAKATKDWLGSK